MKKLFLLFLSFLSLISFSTSNTADAGVPPQQPHKSPTYQLYVKTNKGTFPMKVTFYGSYTHGENYGSKKCSWNAVVKAWYKAELSTGIFVVKWEESVYEANEACSHRSGVKGKCGKHRSLIDGQWAKCDKDLSNQVNAGIELSKNKIIRGVERQLQQGVKVIKITRKL